jgi:LuxR family transcriptional regulator, maltose regulon positive regulatory protein
MSVRSQLVLRPARGVQCTGLLRRLESAGEPLVLLVAPSGFGKTSLLAEWATATGAQVAWLSCEATDGEPARFWSRLTASLAARLAGHNAPRQAPGCALAGAAGHKEWPPVAPAC